MVSDVDLTIAIGIAVVLLLVALCVWPGFIRLKSRDLDGFWASARSGDLYEIRSTGPRAFVCSARAGPDWVAGVVSGVRKVGIAGGGGSVEIGGRHISWSDGEVWVRQGVR